MLTTPSFLTRPCRAGGRGGVLPARLKNRSCTAEAGRALRAFRQLEGGAEAKALGEIIKDTTEYEAAATNSQRNLILGTVAGLLANLAGLPVPAIAEPALTRIGQAAITLGLLAAGAGMGLSSLGSARVLAVSVLTIKHLLLPLGALGMAIAFRLDPLQATVLLAFAAMPTAPSSYVLASKMGYNGPLVGALVTLSNALGAVSLTFALGLLLPLR